jgi:ligand-binding SRPBCC domain-containing protein
MMSKVYSFKKVQLIPASLDRVWDFFAVSDNLRHITPGGMDFKLKSDYIEGKMYPGQIIEYSVKPFFGIPLYWMTEIMHVAEKKYFVDEQRFGPFGLWHHQHHFREVAGGVEMTDIVHYKIPYWFIGDIVHALFVKEKLQGIFNYRYKRVEELFGKGEKF